MEEAILSDDEDDVSVPNPWDFDLIFFFFLGCHAQLLLLGIEPTSTEEATVQEEWVLITHYPPPPLSLPLSPPLHGESRRVRVYSQNVCATPLYGALK